MTALILRPSTLSPAQRRCPEKEEKDGQSGQKEEGQEDKASSATKPTAPEPAAQPASPSVGRGHGVRHGRHENHPGHDKGIKRREQDGAGGHVLRGSGQGVPLSGNQVDDGFDGAVQSLGHHHQEDCRENGQPLPGLEVQEKADRNHTHGRSQVNAQIALAKGQSQSVQGPGEADPDGLPT